MATGLAFAQDQALPVAIRSGGHSYPGLVRRRKPKALVIDVRPLDRVDVSGTTATIGAGAALAHVYDVIGGAGRAIAGGSCPTVGIAGLTIGGGVGVLTRAMGLTCDAVTSMQVVTADGTVRTASAQEEPDLYWALRGGGGGHLGVVTSFELTTVAAPTLSTVYLGGRSTLRRTSSPRGRAGRPMPTTGSGRRSGSRRAVPRRRPDPAALRDLDRAGVGLRRAARRAAGPRPRAIDPLHPRARLSGRDDVVRRLRDDPGRPVHHGARRGPAARGVRRHLPRGLRPTDAGGITDLVDQVQDAQSSGLKEAGISIDALGGRVRDVAPDATAFVHRQALATVQYTATFLPGDAQAADAYVRGFRAAMTPHWGDHATSTTPTRPSRTTARRTSAPTRTGWPRAHRLRPRRVLHPAPGLLTRA